MMLHLGRALIAVCLIVGFVQPSARATASSGSRLVNLSTRGVVGSGDDLLIAGFVIGGSGSKDLLIRALGPSLTQAGLAGSLAHPRLQVFDAAGRVIATQEGWDAALKPLFAQLGASTLPE